MDSITSIIKHSGKDWEDCQVTLSLMGELTIVCDVDEVGERGVSTERSVVEVERSGDDFEPDYEPTIVTITPEGVSKILKIIFDSATRVGNAGSKKKRIDNKRETEEKDT